MERRNIAFGLFAASSAAVVSQRAEAQSCTAPCYRGMELPVLEPGSGVLRE